MGKKYPHLFQKYYKKKLTFSLWFLKPSSLKRNGKITPTINITNKYQTNYYMKTKINK